MDCSSCKRNIEFVLASLRGVEGVKADHRAMTVEVAFDPTVTSETDIRRAVEDMGYTVLA